MDTVSVTVSPRCTSPAAGVWLITRPLSMSGSFSCVVFTLRPSALSAFSASLADLPFQSARVTGAGPCETSRSTGVPGFSGVPSLNELSTSGLSDNSLFPLKNYRAAAQYGARLLGALRRDGLLQQHKFALNVNYPNVSEGKKAKKPKWVSVADGVYSYHVYEKQPDGSYAVSFKPCEGVPACEITRTDADKIWAVDRNHITVAPINWDRTYGYPVDGRRELAKVKAFVEKRAPRP